MAMALSSFSAHSSLCGQCRTSVIASRVTKSEDGRMFLSDRPWEMSMRNLAFTVMLAAIAAVATPAAAFLSSNGFTVTKTGPKEFVVQYHVTRNENNYWCAAGDFVIRELGLSSKTRIYRASPPPRGRGQGITFTLDSAAASKKGGVSSFSKEGSDGSVSAGHARGSLCNFFEDYPFDR